MVKGTRSQIYIERPIAIYIGRGINGKRAAAARQDEGRHILHIKQFSGDYFMISITIHNYPSIVVACVILRPEQELS
jgi:hypothetical protein